MPPEQTPQYPPPSLQVSELTQVPMPTPRPKRRLLLRIFLFLCLIVGALFATGTFVYFKETRAISQLEINGSAEYKSYIGAIDNLDEQWLETEAEMKADGSTQEEIELAHKDFINFFGQTYLLKIQLGDTKLTESEKRGVILKLAELVKDNPSLLEEDKICRYKEEILPNPPDLQDTTLTLENSVHLAKGEDPENCSPALRGIRLEIVPNDMISNITVGKKYFEEQGRSVVELPEGKKFSLDKIAYLTDRGLFGGSPLKHLVLRDEQGNLYQVATIYLDNNESSDDEELEEIFGSNFEKVALSYSKNGKNLGVLTYKYFDEYAEQQTTSAIVIDFKGGTSESEITQFKNLLIKQQWAKSADYVSAQENLDTYKQRHANDQAILAALDELGENPLGATLTLHLNYPAQKEAREFIKTQSIYTKINRLLNSKK